MFCFLYFVKISNLVTMYSTAVVWRLPRLAIFFWRVLIQARLSRKQVGFVYDVAIQLTIYWCYHFRQLQILKILIHTTFILKVTSLQVSLKDCEWHDIKQPYLSYRTFNITDQRSSTVPITRVGSTVHGPRAKHIICYSRISPLVPTVVRIVDRNPGSFQYVRVT